MAKITLDTDTFSKINSEELKKIAVEDKDSGTFTIDVVPVTFRDANIELKQQIEDRDKRLRELTTLVGTDDLDAAKTQLTELRGIKEKVDNKKLVEDSSFEDALKLRTTEMRQLHEERQKASAKAIEEKERLISSLKGSLDDNQVSTQLQLAVMSDKSGIRPEAFPDILHRARGVFKVEDGKLVARDDKGEKIYGEDANPLNVDGWLKKLTDDAPHFLKSTVGGGAQGGRGGAARFSSADMATMDQKTFERLRAEEREKKAR